MRYLFVALALTLLLGGCAGLQSEAQLEAQRVAAYTTVKESPSIIADLNVAAYVDQLLLAAQTLGDEVEAVGWSAHEREKSAGYDVYFTYVERGEEKLMHWILVDGQIEAGNDLAYRISVRRPLGP